MGDGAINNRVRLGNLVADSIRGDNQIDAKETLIIANEAMDYISTAKESELEEVGKKIDLVLKTLYENKPVKLRRDSSNFDTAVVKAHTSKSLMAALKTVGADLQTGVSRDDIRNALKNTLSEREKEVEDRAFKARGAPNAEKFLKEFNQKDAFSAGGKKGTNLKGD